jgi:DNA-directed RNA polymerase specialized sigma24 family protein
MGVNNFSGEHSVTQWLAALKADQSVASQRLWKRYVEKLARLARKKLAQVSCRIADEEDIVVEVFTDFLSGVKERRFERLSDRNDLWQILAMLTERNVISHIRREKAAKRGHGRVHGESAFANSAELSAGPGINQVAGREPTPEFAVEVAENLGRLMRLLESDMLRALARDNLTGYTQQEMADRNGISLPTVQRKLKLIREMWQRALST